MNRFLISRPVASCLSAVAVSLAASSAFAQVGPADDRSLSSAVGWEIKSNVSIDNFSPSFFSDEGNLLRVTDMQILQVSPMTFSIIAVRNTGAYEIADATSTVGWFHGISFDEVNALKSQGRRVTVLREYINGDGSSHFAGVTVPNSGSDARDWKLVTGSWGDHVEAPTNFRPAIATTTRAFGGNTESLLVVDNTTDKFSCHVNWQTTISEVRGSTASNERTVDATPLDDGSEDFAAVFCDESNSIGGVIDWSVAQVNGSGLGTFALQTGLRPLFLAHSTDTVNDLFPMMWVTAFVGN